MSERKGSQWSIAIYTGRTPLVLQPAPGIRSPVLTADDVRDVPAAFVADPFMVREDGRWYLFCEVKNQSTRLGEIGLATSLDGLSWQYCHTVLRESFHLSYPQVFRWDGDYYMVPETLELEAVTLYRANPFPDRWERVGALVHGKLADPTLFHYNDRWWMLACPTPYQHDSLCLYHAENLGGPWRPHPRNPLVEGSRATARPGGRVIAWDGGLIRYAQDCVPVYGTRLRAFRIAELDTEKWSEVEAEESPVLEPGLGWNATGMHHADPHRLDDGSWLACVDGYVYVEP
ncbi:MAG TPA: hypothetical protein VGL72_25385 [Bryobacteraceae bacterium]